MVLRTNLLSNTRTLEVSKNVKSFIIGPGLYKRKDGPGLTLELTCKALEHLYWFNPERIKDLYTEFIRATNSIVSVSLCKRRTESILKCETDDQISNYLHPMAPGLCMLIQIFNEMRYSRFDKCA